MPEETHVKFTEWRKTISPACMVYADFESILSKSMPAATNVVHTHLPIAASFLSIPGFSHHASIPSEYHAFKGPKCVVGFLEQLEVLSHEMQRWYNQNAYCKMMMTTDDDTSFKATTSCYLCGGGGDTLVRDHDHFTGNFLGAACNTCNLERRIAKPFIPIVFHNFKGYDLHHILKHAISAFPHWDITCIPQSGEKFISLGVKIKGGVSLRFIDSLQFLSASLDELTKSVTAKPLTNALTEFPEYMKQTKGYFPYEFAESETVLLETHSLPPKTAFNNISEEEYQLAQRVWVDTKCQNLYQYMMHYLKLDVYLLADVFENFRTMALNQQKIDPANFFSLPGYTWASAIKGLKTQVELLKDSLMYEFFENGIRGGMTFINKHLVQCGDDTELLYIDVNNLYGWALSEKLPVSDFEWVMETRELEELFADKDACFVAQVDLSIPPHLHDALSDLPPAPIPQAPPGSKVKKLLCTLEQKENYIIHHRLLRFYQEMGVVVNRVHKAIKFKEEHVFQPYIAENTAKRAAATSLFEKSFWKLLNNALFGKTVENLRKRMDVRLCSSHDRFVAYASRPTYQRCMEIDQDFLAVFLQKEKICLNRPVFIGQAILDLSKLRMYKLQYVELEKYRRQFDCEINLVAGDTDSFFLECKGVSLDGQLLPAMKEDGLLDTSNFATTNPLYSTTVTNQIGLFKDENCGRSDYTEWVFLRPKCYSLESHSSSAQKAKGVLRRIVKTQLKHKDYKNFFKSLSSSSSSLSTTTSTSPMKHTVMQQLIISKKHQLYTIAQSKVALSAVDDKRYWTDHNSSLPYGHYSLCTN
jgi:hypothetical protein